MGPDTRTRLILAAMELFWEKGYGSTSIADILRTADVHGGSLYHFFPGKQDLLMAVLDIYIGGIQEMLLEPAWRGVADPDREDLDADGPLPRPTDPDRLHSTAARSAASRWRSTSPTRPCGNSWPKNFSNWTVAVEQCLAEVTWPAEADTRRLAEFVLTTMEGGVMLTRTYRDVGYFDRAIAELRAYVALLQKKN